MSGTVSFGQTTAKSEKKTFQVLMCRYFIEYWTTEDGHLLYLVLIDSIETHESQDLAEHFGGTTRSRKIRKFINGKKDLSYLKAQAKQLKYGNKKR